MRFYVLLLVALGYVGIVIFEGAINIIVTILGAVGTLLVSVFRFSADRAKEHEIASLEKKRANYQRLLDAIARFAQSNEGTKDLVAAQTESLAFADPEVVKTTSTFIEKPSQDKLVELLKLMRKDMGLSEVQDMSKLVQNLYQQKTKTTGFPEE